MKRLRKIGYCLVFGLAVGLAIGCRTVNAPTPPLAPVAPGYITSADQTMGETLAAAHTFYNSISCRTQGKDYSVSTDSCIIVDPKKTPLVLSNAEKTAFTALMISLDTAQPVYLGYHHGTATEAQAQTAVSDVRAKQAAVQSLGVR